MIKKEYIKQEYESKSKLCVAFQEIYNLMANQRELVEDYLTLDIQKRYDKIILELYAIKMNIHDSMPLRCICDSFKFKQEKITIVKQKHHDHKCPREHLKPEEYRYVCINCGAEVM